jgi:hypothetical protein
MTNALLFCIAHFFFNNRSAMEMTTTIATTMTTMTTRPLLYIAH